MGTQRSLLQLLEAIAQVDRGSSATDEDKAEIEDLIQILEKTNPNKKSLQADEINGKWKLLYTTSESILGTQRPPFLRPLGPIHQFIGAQQVLLRSLAYARRSHNGPAHVCTA